jgi:hypothetical protein
MYPGINYDFRPKNYWSDASPLAALLRNVKGTERREIILQHAAAGELDQVDEDLVGEEVSELVRNFLGRLHPSFMGGEYLPGYLPGEVEIARIELESTTADVISLRARPNADDGIDYRIVDEYNSEFSFDPESSDQPLTLGELIKLIDEADQVGAGLNGGLALGYNEMNADSYEDRSELRHFTSVDSNVYAQLSKHYSKVFADWVKEGEEMSEE